VSTKTKKWKRESKKDNLLGSFSANFFSNLRVLFSAELFTPFDECCEIFPRPFHKSLQEEKKKKKKKKEKLTLSLSFIFPLL
jgi:hypothetical protein